MSNSCSNSSNISGNLNIRSMTSSGARLLMTHPIEGFSGGVNTLGQVCAYGVCDGVTYGDAVRFDMLPLLPDGETDNPSYQKYVRAQADSAANSEIVGVIESNDDGVVRVVLSGQIVYPAHRFIQATHIDETAGTTGSDGGHDVYFLSEATGGFIQNLAPNSATMIAKPILQRAIDGDFTAHVVNYIGYQIGGQAVASTDEDEEDFTMRIVAIPDGETLSVGRGVYDLSLSNQFLPLHVLDLNYPRNGDLFSDCASRTFTNNPYGARYRVEGVTGFVSSLWNGKKVSLRDSLGKQIWTGKCVQHGDSRYPSENIIWVTSTENEDLDTLINRGYDTLYSSTNEKVRLVSGLKTGMALPRVSASQGRSFVDIQGRRIKTTERTFASFNPNGGKSAVTIPDKMNISQLNAEKIVLEDTSYKISDLFEFLRTMSDQVESTKQAVDGSASTVSNAMKYETK